MTTTTSLYGLLKFAAKEPAALVASIVNQHADTLEAALIAGGVTPANTTAMLTQLAAWNARNTAGDFTDSGWVNITVTAPTAAHTQAPQVRKIGRLVVARGGWSSTGLTANTGTAAGAIPTGYRPSSTLEVAPGMSSAGSTGKASIATTGVVTLAPGGTVPGFFRLDGVTWTVD